MDQKQEVSALDIVELQSKEMWSLLYLTCVDIIFATVTFEFNSK